MAKKSDVLYQLGCSDNAVQAEKETAKVSKYIQDSGLIYKIYPRLWSNISNISVTLVKYIEYIFDSD